MNSQQNKLVPGESKCHIAGTFGTYVSEALDNDPDFYFFSPDETTSNRMQQVYDVTDRAWQQKEEAWDQNLAKDGKVIEMLSENTLFAVLAGHILSGGRGAMTSYEAFLPIISSQLDQHLKFLKQSKEVTWRPDYEALNILSTSCWQRQDHNGYTHQNPALISSLLTKPSNLSNCFFPVDDNAAEAAWKYMTESKNVVNLATFNKNPQPRWIDVPHAYYQLDCGGASVFDFASDSAPWVIVAGVGDLPTQEALEGMKLARLVYPDLRLRFVNIAALSFGAIGTTNNKLSHERFEKLFGNWPVVVNFHGYADSLRAIIAHYTDPRRFHIHGYEDQGSTTSPLDELARNHCSRWDIAEDILRICEKHDLANDMVERKVKNSEYAALYGVDE